MILCMGIILLVAILLSAVLSFVLRNRRRASREFVIGREMAEAAKVEQKHQAGRDPNKPPLLDGEYDFWRGEMNLINPQPSPLDEKIRALCQRFLESSAAERKSIRSALSMDDFYTLMTFSKRSAVFALREKSINHVTDGFVAVAIVDRERVDYRDIPMTLCLPYHAADRLGENAYQIFRKIAYQTSDGLATHEDEIPESAMAERFRIQLWGFDEVNTRYGVGFSHHSYADYQPTYDLVNVAVEIADLFATDKYQLDNITTGVEVPPVWLKPAGDPTLEEILRAVRAAVSIHAKLRPDADPSSDSQMLLTFLVEVSDEAKAKQLQEISGKVKTANHSLIGCSAGRLFCVVVQAPWTWGVETYESPESLSRFSEGITHVLERCTASSQ